MKKEGFEFSNFPTFPGLHTKLNHIPWADSCHHVHLRAWAWSIPWSENPKSSQVVCVKLKQCLEILKSNFKITSRQMTMCSTFTPLNGHTLRAGRSSLRNGPTFTKTRKFSLSSFSRAKMICWIIAKAPPGDRNADLLVEFSIPNQTELQRNDYRTLNWKEIRNFSVLKDRSKCLHL